MKIGIIGNRDYPCQEHIELLVSILPEDTRVVSGGAIGPDSWAAQAAIDRGLPIPLVFPIEQVPGMSKSQFTQKAHERNYRIVENSDFVIAFVCRPAGGTWHTLNCADQVNKPTLVLGPVFWEQHENPVEAIKDTVEQMIEAVKGLL